MNMNDQLGDQNSRDRIATEMDKCFFVEAGPGSGKTHSLVDRIAGLIRGGVKLENISAVTFTRKAAKELKERFQIRLEKDLRDKDLGEKERECISTALRSIEKTRILTIHSFCAHLLRERPLEAGVDPKFNEMDEDENRINAQKVWLEFLDQKDSVSNEISVLMNEEGINKNDLFKIYMKRLAYSEVDVVVKEVKKPDLGPVKERVAAFLEEIRNAMPEKKPEKGWDSLQGKVVQALGCKKHGYFERDSQFIDLMRIFNSQSINVTLNRWDDVDDAKTWQESFENIQGSVIRPAIREWGEYLHKPFMDFVEKGVIYYEQWRMERSMLNFQDLLISTAKLLRENSEVRLYFKKRITHLLVDEFQDTDLLQAEIIMLLTGEDNELTRWQSISPKPGSLFVVGDPKQSIYRFRRADIDIYNQVKKIFSDGAGEVLELSSNFRSVNPIGGFVNNVFKDIFPFEGDKYQPQYVKLNTAGEVPTGFTCGVYENNLPQVDRNTPKKIAVEDAKSIASFIHKALDGKIKIRRSDEQKQIGLTDKAIPSDFLIITKTKKRINTYAEALDKQGIPYEISGGENFKASYELRYICQLLNAVINPQDPVALIAALRGLFFGLSDNDLYKFKVEGGTFSYVHAVKDTGSPVGDAFARLREFYEISKKYSPITAYEMIIEKCGIIPHALSLKGGEIRAGNIFKSIDILHELKITRTGSFSDLVDRLGELFENSSAEEMSLEPGQVKAVRIMNLHKVKGLEAPVIFLADPLGNPRVYDPDLYIDRMGDSAKGYFVINRQKGYFFSEPIAFPPNWDMYEEEERKYEIAERQRLEYVAATRARDYLVVSKYTDGSAEKAWHCMYNHLKNSLAMDEGEIKETPKEKLSIDLEDKKRSIEEAAKKIASLSAASYAFSRVTTEAQGSAEYEFSDSDSKGMFWGNVIHKALEECAKGNRGKLKNIIRNCFSEDDLTDKDIEQALIDVDKVLDSPLWKRIDSAEQKYAEIPFSLKRDEGKYLNGMIDLIFKEGDEWVIVDYKTGDPESDPAKKETYQQQLNMYSECWQDLTGDKVKETILYKIGE